MSKRKTVRVDGCPRCGDDHGELPFRMFTVPMAGCFLGWAVCPVLREPIALSDAEWMAREMVQVSRGWQHEATGVLTTGTATNTSGTVVFSGLRRA
jgi:hypothetical protein